MAMPYPAQSERISPMSYTTIQTREKNNGNNDGAMKFRQVEPAKDAKPASANADEGQEETPAMRVWRKYKSLASGQPEEAPQEQTDPANTQPAPDMPAVPVPAVGEDAPSSRQAASPQMNAQTQQQSPPPTGFQAVLQEYQRAKEQRRSMRSITVKQPDLPQQPEKPTAAAPQ
jgi:hypothetical protein